MVATGYANPTAKELWALTTLRVALTAHSLSNNRPERNENCVTHVAGLKCYLCWRLQRLTRKCIEMALGGDTAAMKLCMERLCPVPKDRAVTFDLPDISTPRDAAD